MAFVLRDRVKETTTVTGTGAATLLGAVTGFDAFSTLGDGNTTYYVIAHQTADEWEVGIGTYTLAGTSLARDTVLSSSNSDLAVTFSSGTKDVFVSQPASRAVFEDDNTDAAIAGDLTVTGALGVGTSTPDGILHLDNGASNTDFIIEKDAGTVASIIFHNAGVAEASMIYDSAELLVIETTLLFNNIELRTNSGQVLVTPGSVSFPGVAFSNDPDTGFFRTAANNWAFAANGSISLRGDEFGIFTASGAETTPAVVFNNDGNTGIWRPGADTWAVSTGGIEALRIDPSRNVGIGTAAVTPARRLQIRDSTSLTNAVTYPERLTHVTSGTPAANIGVGIEFEVETAAANNEILATIETIATVVTATSEVGAVVIKTMDGGAAAAERMRVDVTGIKLGASTARGTTEPTNAVTLFNGTVPVGTLVNGVTLYSKDVAASAELHVMDEAGNESLLSPHDPATGEWIFYSKNTITGRVIRIRMEKLLRRVAEQFGPELFEEFYDPIT